MPRTAAQIALFVLLCAVTLSAGGYVLSAALREALRDLRRISRSYRAAP